MRMSIVAVVFVCCSYVGLSLGQSSSPGPHTQEINAQNANNVCRIYFTNPKASSEYEAGRKKHMQFHRAHKDTWTWNTYSIETGEKTGWYVTSSCGHAWKDFDEWEARMGKADTADGNINLTPYTKDGHNGFYVYRADMSLAPANQPVSPLTWVTIYTLHPGMVTDFIATVKKINEALTKQADWPKTSGWLQLVNGGRGPEFVLLSSRKNYADMAPLPKSVADVLDEAYGKETSDQLQKSLRDCTDKVSSELAQYHADLSYSPEK